MRFLSAAAVLVACFTAVGCSRSKPQAVKVAVKVLYRQSTPARGAFVVFHPADPDLQKRIGGRPFGYAGDDGTVSLTTFQEGDGAPEGDYVVTVVWEKKKDVKDGLTFEGGGAADMLEGRYGDPKVPKLKATVKTGQTNDFTLLVE
jgi:hypothetical protein